MTKEYKVKKDGVIFIGSLPVKCDVRTNTHFKITNDELICIYSPKNDDTASFPIRYKMHGWTIKQVIKIIKPYC